MEDASSHMPWADPTASPLLLSMGESGFGMPPSDDSFNIIFNRAFNCSLQGVPSQDRTSKLRLHARTDNRLDVLPVAKSAIGDTNAQMSMVKTTTRMETIRTNLTKAKEELAEVKYANFITAFSPSPRVKNYEFSENETEAVRVRGRLRSHISFWESINASAYVLKVIKEGYQFPLISEPPSVFLKNNKSAKIHREFVTEAVLELIATERVQEVPAPSYVVNPLSVSVKGSDRRLILDLRHVNLHVFKSKIKFDDWRVMEDLVETGGYLFKFDLKQGYHHIDIHPEFQKYLGFSWTIGGTQRYFVFSVLPFGLTSAPYIFTKIVRCLVKFWRGAGVKFCCFLDDGIGTNISEEVTKLQADFVRSSLRESGFLANQKKSVWAPTQIITWLGIVVNLKEGFFSISESRESSILNWLKSIIDRSPYSSARKFSKVTGKMMSTKFVLGNIVRLKTRQFYRIINNRKSWDSRLSFANEAGVIGDLHFWQKNFSRLNRRDIKPYSVPAFLATSDASKSGLAAHLEVNGAMQIAYEKFLCP